jgi:ERCC4 domain-containing protein
LSGVPPRTFLVALNPDPDSSLPYLLRLPVDGGLELKARERWPVTARVYCHPVDEWPAGAEVVEEVPVLRCERRGRAIDLVLDRGRNNRSQFVFVFPDPDRPEGRRMIFWQTPRTARRSRPGQRAPGRRAEGVKRLTIVVDSRERYGYRFAERHVEKERRALPSGDYAVMDGDRVVAAVERKTLEDLARRLIDGSLAFAVAQLAELPLAAVVVEERYGALVKVERAEGAFLCDLVAQLQVRYPSVPVVFCDSRKLAEDWTYRFLAAALVQQRAAEAAGGRRA